jgi:acetyl esterase/lipase
MKDGEAAYLEARARGYDGDRIVLMGESLGTGVAIALAATREAAALVLDSPYSSAVEVAAAHYPIFPVNWLMLDSSIAECWDCVRQIYGLTTTRLAEPVRCVTEEDQNPRRAVNRFSRRPGVRGPVRLARQNS